MKSTEKETLYLHNACTNRGKQYFPPKKAISKRGKRKKRKEKAASAERETLEIHGWLNISHDEQPGARDLEVCQRGSQSVRNPMSEPDYEM
ncbi:hypothetical protein CEXT_604981 [Caerostris extrusa]|uniref:Uncharacterized protein n=1 Tax=Caerostris extrusa TaxID=172846 RepID=A0AAV4X8M4_CAEEX|nr:hypothetical protein CEXT_604981 [Caerostris extrusa]